MVGTTHPCSNVSKTIYRMDLYISMASWKTAISPLLTQWRYCSLPLSHQYCKVEETSQRARFMGPTWGPPGSCRPQMGPMLAPWTFLSGLGLHWLRLGAWISNGIHMLTVLSLIPTHSHRKLRGVIIHPCPSKGNPRMGTPAPKTAPGLGQLTGLW